MFVVVCQSVSGVDQMACLAVAIEMLRLNVCWNHIEGVEVLVWYVSPYVSDVSCLQMALTCAQVLWRIRCEHNMLCMG
jgi:hypothetical protein